MCIWGVELQTEGGWRGEGAQTRSVPAASVSSRPTRHSPVPPILPTSPFRPLCWQWDSLPDHPSRTADGQGSPVTRSFLGSALAYSAGTPCLGGCQLFPVLPRWHPPLAIAVGCRLSCRDALTLGMRLVLVRPCLRPCSSPPGSLLLGLRGAVSWGWFAFLTETS